MEHGVVWGPLGVGRSGGHCWWVELNGSRPRRSRGPECTDSNHDQSISLLLKVIILRTYSNTCPHLAIHGPMYTLANASSTCRYYANNIPRQYSWKRTSPVERATPSTLFQSISNCWIVLQITHAGAVIFQENVFALSLIISIIPMPNWRYVMHVCICLSIHFIFTRYSNDRYEGIVSRY